MRITQVSEVTGLDTETLRYYERTGLIPTIKRDQDGIRDYETKDVEWITLVSHLLKEGISEELLLEFVFMEKDHQSGRQFVLEEMCTCLEKRKCHIDDLLEQLHLKIHQSS